MERGLRELETRTNAELFYFKVRVRPFCPCSPRSFLFKTIPEMKINLSVPFEANSVHSRLHQSK